MPEDRIEGTEEKAQEPVQEDIQDEEETQGGEDQGEEEEEEEEEGEEEEVEDDPDNPLNDPESPLQDVLASLGDIDNELERLRKKNITNLKYELQFKVYPIIKQALEGIIGWIAEDHEEEAAEAYAAGVEELREVCNKIISMNDPNANHAEILADLIESAKEKLSQLPEEESEPEEESDNKENDDE